jgi:hypothetical protein
MRPKFTLKDLKFTPKTEVPVAPPPPKTQVIVDPAPKPPAPGLPQAVWCQFHNQWLRVVIDNRIGVGRRVFRIELYDSNREKRLAIFRRQTEAIRQ